VTLERKKVNAPLKSHPREENAHQSTPAKEAA